MPSGSASWPREDGSRSGLASCVLVSCKVFKNWAKNGERVRDGEALTRGTCRENGRDEESEECELWKDGGNECMSLDNACVGSLWISLAVRTLLRPTFNTLLKLADPQSHADCTFNKVRRVTQRRVTRTVRTCLLFSLLTNTFYKHLEIANSLSMRACEIVVYMGLLFVCRLAHRKLERRHSVYRLRTVNQSIDGHCFKEKSKTN